MMPRAESIGGEEIVRLLDELGFHKGSIVETILTTRDGDGSLRAAPMGVRRVGSVDLEIRPFKSSRTYGNLSRGGWARVNLSEDPELYLVTAFKEEAFGGFPQPEIDEDLSIPSADASLLVEVVEGFDEGKRGRFLCRVRSVRIHRRIPRVFSRGRAEAIEAIIHATRVKAFHEMGDPQRVWDAYRRFEASREIVERVSPEDSPEMRVIRRLEEMIKGWVVDHEGACQDPI
jgi:hypothetical protein